MIKGYTLPPGARSPRGRRRRGRKGEKLSISLEGAWFSGNQAAHPGVPGRGAEGVRELLGAPRGAAGRLPDSSAPPESLSGSLGDHFFNFSDKIWPPRSRLHTKVAEFGVAFGF